MREWIRPVRNNDSDAESTERRPSFLQGLAEFVRDEAIDQAVNKASGGWLSYEGSDDEEDESRRNPTPPADSFNDRIERAMAELRAKEQGAAAGSANNGDPQASALPYPSATHRPATPSPSTNPPAIARGFGRKIV